MISILICSKDPLLASRVSANIHDTIGVQHEVLVYDNSIRRKGICEVYNLLASDAQFDFLCFAHEDIVFTDNNWGILLINAFLSERAGVIGVAGSKFKSAYFSGWYTNNPAMDCAVYTHQYPGHSEKVVLNPEPGSMFQEVVCIDGVFIGCTKKVWEEIKFSPSIPGFHFYDIDFSLRASKKFKVGVVFNIHLIHITSGGDYGDRWVEAAIWYHANLKDQLPYSKWAVPFKKMNRRVVLSYLDFLKNYKITITNKLKWIRYQRLLNNPLFYISILKFLLYQPLGLRRILRRNNY